MKKKFIIASLCAVCASAFAFSACGGSGDGLSVYVDGMKKSADGAVSVNAKVELIDEGVPVYVFNRLIQVDLQTKTASVADSRTVYSDNFEQKTTTSTSSVDNVSGSAIVGLNLSESLVSAYEIKDGDLTCTIPQEKISEVLKSSVSAKSEMTLSVDFEGGKMVGVSYSYENTNSRTVSVTVTYAY